MARDENLYAKTQQYVDMHGMNLMIDRVATKFNMVSDRITPLENRIEELMKENARLHCELKHAILLQRRG